MDQKLILIASYPKSGNTWTRLVLQGLLDPKTAGDVNALNIGLYGKNKRDLFDHFVPANASEMFWDEIASFSPFVYSCVAAQMPGPLVIKTHELLERNADGLWPYPPELVRCVLHLVRHPFDVAASFANHMGRSSEEAVRMMRDDFWLGTDRAASDSLPEHVGSWSRNIESWLSSDVPYRVVTTRYEDLLEDQVAGFAKLMRETGLSFGEEDLHRAVSKSRFDKVRVQEEMKGFREKPQVSRRFFRSGSRGSWKGVLSPQLRRQLSKDHAESMLKLGYRSDGSSS